MKAATAGLYRIPAIETHRHPWRRHIHILCTRRAVPTSWANRFGCLECPWDFILLLARAVSIALCLPLASESFSFAVNLLQRFKPFPVLDKFKGNY